MSRIRLLFLLAALPLSLATVCSKADAPLDDSSASGDSGVEGDADTDADADTDTDTDADADLPDHVIINELLALNETGITDEADQFEDWIELYNPTSSAIDLTGWSMTDDYGIEEPWPFPDNTVITAGSYLLIWCDEDDDGPLHAAFKLSGDGEAATLLDPDGQVIDELTFPAQSEDISYGHVPDATGDLQPIDPPTPGSSNG
ncbi:MAG: lamin tail domain-containing protein [Alphaproteobacteria bacterium]|nr:lamin tail domain-containing protein [Alphaproteobacteria bacterium]